MKKTIFVMLIDLLLVSSIASAGFWDKLTGNAFFGFGKKAANSAATSAQASTGSPSVKIVTLQCGQTDTVWKCGHNATGTIQLLQNVTEGHPRAYATVRVDYIGVRPAIQSIDEGSSGILNKVRVNVVDLWADPATFSSPSPVCGAVLALKCADLRIARATRISYWSSMFSR